MPMKKKKANNNKKMTQRLCFGVLEDTTQYLERTYMVDRLRATTVL